MPISHDTSDLTTQGFPWPWPTRSPAYADTQIGSKIVPRVPQCAGNSLRPHYKERIVAKWVVGVLLECFLVTVHNVVVAR